MAGAIGCWLGGAFAGTVQLDCSEVDPRLEFSVGIGIGGALFTPATRTKEGIETTSSAHTVLGAESAFFEGSSSTFVHGWSARDFTGLPLQEFTDTSWWKWVVSSLYVVAVRHGVRQQNNCEARMPKTAVLQRLEGSQHRLI